MYTELCDVCALTCTRLHHVRIICEHRDNYRVQRDRGCIPVGISV